MVSPRQQKKLSERVDSLGKPINAALAMWDERVPLVLLEKTDPLVKMELPETPAVLEPLRLQVPRPTSLAHASQVLLVSKDHQVHLAQMDQQETLVPMLDLELLDHPDQPDQREIPVPMVLLEILAPLDPPDKSKLEALDLLDPLDQKDHLDPPDLLELQDLLEMLALELQDLPEILDPMDNLDKMAHQDLPDHLAQTDRQMAAANAQLPASSPDIHKQSGLSQLHVPYLHKPDQLQIQGNLNCCWQTFLIKFAILFATFFYLATMIFCNTCPCSHVIGDHGVLDMKHFPL